MNFFNWKNFYQIIIFINVDMSEWLRRQTRNLLGFACVGSNPAIDVFKLFISWVLAGSRCKSSGCRRSRRRLGGVYNPYLGCLTPLVAFFHGGDVGTLIYPENRDVWDYYSLSRTLLAGRCTQSYEGWFTYPLCIRAWWSSILMPEITLYRTFDWFTVSLACSS